MPRDKDAKDRERVLILFNRLRLIILKQEEHKDKLTSEQNLILSKSIFATYLDLNDLGYGKAALWYIRRKPTKLFSKLRLNMPEGVSVPVAPDPVMKNLADALFIYRVILDFFNNGGNNPFRISHKEVMRSFAKLKRAWHDAVAAGYKDLSVELLASAGFTPHIFIINDLD